MLEELRAAPDIVPSCVVEKSEIEGMGSSMCIDSPSPGLALAPADDSM